MCDSNRPTEYYRLTVSSVLGDRVKPRKPPTGIIPEVVEPYNTAASVRYNTDMGPVDLMHEGGDWGVLVESFCTGEYQAKQIEGASNGDASKVDANAGWGESPAMFVSIPELSVGGNYSLEAGDKSMPYAYSIVNENGHDLRQGTCVPTTNIGGAMCLRENVRQVTALTNTQGKVDEPLTYVHHYLEHPQTKPTRCRCAPMDLQSMTVELLDARGNALNSKWMRESNKPIVSDPGASPVVRGANFGLDYTMTLLFMRM